MLNLSPEFSGEWIVEVFDRSTGKTAFPFGNTFRKNTLLSVGIQEILHASYSLVHGIYNFQTIPVFLAGGAAIGGGSTPPTSSDTGMETLLQTSTTMLTSHREYSCKYEDDVINGSRSYTRVFDFAEFSNPTTIREAGLYSTVLSNTYYSRFLFPVAINLLGNQNIRLIYKFTAKIAAIKTPISVSYGSSGGFDPSGQIKLVGNFNDVFGAMDSSGKPIIIDGDTPISCVVPFCETYHPHSGSSAAGVIPTAYWIKSGQPFSAVNSHASFEIVGSGLSSGSVFLSGFVSGQNYRDCTYIFDGGNPDGTGDFVGGILFTNKILSTNESENRDITWAGWMLKFNEAQAKEAGKKLSITLRSYVSGI